MDADTYAAYSRHCINTGHALDTLIRWRHNYHDIVERERNAPYFEGAEYALEDAISRIYAVMLEEYWPDYEPVETIDDITRRVHHVIAWINQRRCEYERHYETSDFARGRVDAYIFALRIIGIWML